MERNLLENERRILGPDDNDTLATTEELAFTMCTESKAACEKGIEMTREVLNQEKAAFGPDADRTLGTTDNLAIMLAGENRFDEALALQQDSVDRHLRLKGAENIGTIDAMLNLGEFQRDGGHVHDAERTFQELLDIETRSLGPDQVETAVTRYDLASVLLRAGRKWQAIALLRQSVEHGLAPRIARGLRTDPLFVSLHHDPKFTALLADVQKRFPSQAPSKTK